MQPKLSILSLGLGVQSVALYLMSSLGEIPRVDYAIVADTGREKSSTYRYLKYLLDWKEKNDGIPIIVKSERNLYADLLNLKNDGQNPFASIPAFTHGADGVGMLKRQCTYNYKVQVVDNAIREIYQLNKGQRRPLTAVWKGITTDELDRMAEPRERWKIHVYPFTGFEFDRSNWRRLSMMESMDRNQVVAWYARRGFPLPEKSACVFCPYQSDTSWARMKENSPADFAAAVKIDEAIRNSTKKSVSNPCFLHRSLKPLSTVDFNTQNDLWSGECSGNCHT